MKTLQPAHWAKPRGYANGIAARGTIVCVAGQIGWNAAQEFESDRFLDQARQAEAGAKPRHIARLTWYVLDKREYLALGPELGLLYREIIGRHYPAMTAVQVSALIEDRARLEIEATAVVPD